MDSKSGEIPDLLYEEIAGSTESLMSHSTLRKLCSVDSVASSSLSYSAVSSVSDLTEVLRLRESVTQVKSQVAQASSPEQIRASMELLRSSSLRFSQKRSRVGEVRSDRQEGRTMDTRKSAEHLIALAENQTTTEANVQVTTDVILQVFRQVGRPSVEQLITLVRRLKRAPESDSSELSRRLREEQKRTDLIKQQLMESKSQISDLSLKLQAHNSKMDELQEALSELYSMSRTLNDNWIKERRTTDQMKAKFACEEAATIKRSLQETEKRYQETKRMLGAEAIKMTEMKQKLPSPESMKTISIQTERDSRVEELKEERDTLIEHLEHTRETLHTIESALDSSLQSELDTKEDELAAMRKSNSELEAIFRDIIAAGKDRQ